MILVGVLMLLAVLALIFTILTIMGKTPLWIAVLLLCIIAILQAGGGVIVR